MEEFRGDADATLILGATPIRSLRLRREMQVDTVDRKTSFS